MPGEELRLYGGPHDGDVITRGDVDWSREDWLWLPLHDDTRREPLGRGGMYRNGGVKYDGDTLVHQFFFTEMLGEHEAQGVEAVEGE